MAIPSVGTTYVDFSFIQAHPTMTLEEYFKIEQERQEKERQEKERQENNHKQWIIDNLCGKCVLFKMNNAVRMLKFDYKENKIVAHTIYEFYGEQQAFIGHKNSKRFTFDNIENDEKDYFNLLWIKSPYNHDALAKSAYIICESDYEEMLDTFRTFEKNFKAYFNFDKNVEFATKVY